MERESKALQQAKYIDTHLLLPPDETVIISRFDEIPSSPNIFLHTNSSTWENDALSVHALTNQVQACFRVFLENLYREAGYIPIWDRKPFGPHRIRQRSGSVSYHCEVLRQEGITWDDLDYLVGDDSGYNESHEYVHSLPVSVVAAGMSKYIRVFDVGTRRAEVYKNCL